MLVAFASLYVVLQPFIMARPHVFAWVFLAGWTSVLLASRDAGRPPPWALVALMFVWANVHASFFLGFVVAACVALDACIDARWSRPVVLRWFLFGLASLVASLLNANGLPGFLHPFMISGMETLQSIARMEPEHPAFHSVLLRHPASRAGRNSAQAAAVPRRRSPSAGCDARPGLHAHTAPVGLHDPRSADRDAEVRGSGRKSARSALRFAARAPRMDRRGDLRGACDCRPSAPQSRSAPRDFCQPAGPDRPHSGGTKSRSRS